MTTGNSDLLVASRDPTVGNGSLLGNSLDGEADKNSCASGTTRTRKKVTFDLDLQVRTIPNRIPVYERRPAYNNSGHLIRGRTPQSYAFVPKPLDIRGRDRYLIGAANLSAKRIVDLFSVPNGNPNYPSPPRGQTRTGQPAWRRQSPTYGSAATTGSAAVRHPAYAFDGTKSAKMSRAAANLKQITAALGEHFDSSVYQEWDTSSASSKRGVAPAPQRGADPSDSSATTGACTTVTLAPSRSYTPPKPRTFFPYRHQLTTKSISPTDSNQDSSADSTRTSLTERSRSTSYAGESSRKLPVVVDDQQPSMNDSQLIISKAPSNQRPDVRRRIDGGGPVGTDRFRRVPSARDRERQERASSRCSTIDTYVISEPFDVDNSSSTSSRGLGTRIGSGRRMAPTPGKTRSMAWEGADISITEPALTANALRTYKPGQSNLSSGSMANWQVSSKPVNR